MSDTRVPGPVPTSVYRYYDAADILLYVGVTSRGTARNREHWSTKRWWQYVSHQEIDHFDSRDNALERERELIAAFSPPFNKQHNPAHKHLQTIYLAYAAAYQPGNESFIDLYRRTNHRVALRPMVERGGPPDDVWFATLPEHHVIARTMTIAPGKKNWVRVAADHGRPFGQVIEVVHGRGMVVLLRAHVSGAPWPPTTASAVLKLVDNKRLVTRITCIEASH